MHNAYGHLSTTNNSFSDIFNQDNENESVLLDIQGLANTLGIGINKAYELVKSCTIKSFRIGKTWKIPYEAVNEYIRTAAKLS